MMDEQVKRLKEIAKDFPPLTLGQFQIVACGRQCGKSLSMKHAMDVAAKKGLTVTVVKSQAPDPSKEVTMNGFRFPHTDPS